MLSLTTNFPVSKMATEHLCHSSRGVRIETYSGYRWLRRHMRSYTRDTGHWVEVQQLKLYMT